MKHKTITLLCTLALYGSIHAQDLGIQPHPQDVIFKEKTLPLPLSFQLIGADEANPQTAKQLRAILGERISTKGFPLYIGEKTDKAIRNFKKMIPNKAEGYYFSIDQNRIVLAGNDERGTFYATQSLIQLLKAEANTGIIQDTLPIIEVKDYPDIRFRGVVEGFYGTPWSHEARLRQLRFYGENKLNTYIYGPKDDPYHSTPNWRLPYPDKESRQLKELIETAHENEVDFVWAIHPGQDIKWNEADRNKVIEKFESMYQLGIRSFAVFFDDISGDGTDANRQAELLNYIDNQFIKVKKDVTPLIMCPTEYNKSWSNPKGNYLTTLGTNLNSNIQIMWTGDRVISDMSLNGLNWINERIKRPAYIWWNFPVSDYVRDHLLMGAVYGNEKGIEKEMSGFVANPMEHAEASKIALFGVAEYTWNMGKYDSQQAWEQAIQKLVPDAAHALSTFCKHNSDLGSNGHGYRRVESVEIQPRAEQLLKAIQSGQEYDINDFIKLKNEFDLIVEASDLLQTSHSNPALIEEMKPWLYQFRLLGEQGNQVLYMAEALKHGVKDLFERKYAYMRALQQLSYRVDQNYNQNPYQPGVKTGSKVLQPFIDQAFAAMTQRFNDQYDAKLSIAASYSPHKLTSDVDQLRNQPLQTKNNTVLISPLLEVIKWSAGKSVIIEFDQVYSSFSLDFNFGAKEIPTWGKLEISTNGKDWKTIEFTKGKKEMNVKVIRLSNGSEKNEETYLKRFAVTLTK